MKRPRLPSRRLFTSLLTITSQRPRIQVSCRPWRYEYGPVAALLGIDLDEPGIQKTAQQAILLPRDFETARRNTHRNRTGQDFFPEHVGCKDIVIAGLKRLSPQDRALIGRNPPPAPRGEILAIRRTDRHVQNVI